MANLTLKSVHWISISILVLLLLFSKAGNAGVAGLPDSAQPGVQRPQSDIRSTVPDRKEEEVVEIPAVIDRPLAIDEGDRIMVKQFNLLNVEELPELDFTITEVEDYVEQLRQQRPEGFTIGRLQEIADQVTRYYRDRGLVLAQAVIPVQDVSSGVVSIEVFIGYLDRVLVEGNQVYDEQVLTAVFAELIDQPIIQNRIEAALLRLTDYPGLRVYGVFQPGQLVGTADLVINVQEEERLENTVRFDNHGTQVTGRLRGRINLDWNSLYGQPDRLSALVQQTYNPKESLYHSLEYQRFLTSGFLIGGSWDRSDYSVGGAFADQNIKGDSEDFSVYLEKSWLRSRQENLSSRLRFTHSRAVVLVAGQDESREALSVLNLSTQYDLVDSFDPMSFLRADESDFVASSINFVTFEISQGLESVFGAIGSEAEVAALPATERPSRQGGSGEFVSGDFTRVFASFTRYQNISYSQSFLLRLELQWSDDLLLSQEQYSIGGPNSVRAFSPSFQLVDNAGFLSLEYIFDAPFIADLPVLENYTLADLLQFSVYYDAAFGKLNDPEGFEEAGWKSYQGVGFGVQFNLPGRFDSRLSVAWPLGTGENAVLETGNGREPQIWLNLSVSF